MFLFADILPAFVGEEKRVGLWARQCKGLLSQDASNDPPHGLYRR